MVAEIERELRSHSIKLKRELFAAKLTSKPFASRYELVDMDAYERWLSQNPQWACKLMTRGIYQIACGPTQRVYVGSSERIEQRWYNHRLSLTSGNHYVTELQADWDEHGADAFAFTVLERMPRHVDLLTREKTWMTTLRNEGVSLYNRLGM